MGFETTDQQRNIVALEQRIRHRVIPTAREECSRRAELKGANDAKAIPVLIEIYTLRDQNVGEARLDFVPSSTFS